jgi:hypothetical protein
MKETMLKELYKMLLWEEKKERSAATLEEEEVCGVRREAFQDAITAPMSVSGIDYSKVSEIFKQAQAEME